MPSFASLWSNSGAVNSAASDPSLDNKAMSDMDYQIPSAFSLPNFLLELDDIPRMWDSVTGLAATGARNIRRLQSGIASGRKPNWGEMVEDLTKQIADKYLGYQFGFKPLMADLDSTLKVSSGLDKRMGFLKKTKGKVTTIRHSKTTHLIPNPSWTSPWGNFDIKWTPESGYATHVTGAYLYHELEGLDDARSYGKALAHRLGFNRFGSVLWDAIPFSFLIDYVSNVGDLAQAFDVKSAFNGAWNVTNAWSSTKVFDSCSASLSISVPFAASGSIGTFTRRTYNRGAGVSTNQGLILNTGSLSQTQFSNIAALIRQGL